MSTKGTVQSLLLEEFRAREAGDFDKALELLDRILVVDPKCGEAHNNKGAILMMRERYTEAVRELEAAIGIDPSNAQAHNNLGACYFKLGRHEDAIPELQTALSMGYRHEGVYHTLALVLLRLGRCQEALDHFITLLRLNPVYAPALRDLARLAGSARMFGAKHNPTSVEDVKQLKQCLDRMGNPHVW